MPRLIGQLVFASVLALCLAARPSPAVAISDNELKTIDKVIASTVKLIIEGTDSRDQNIRKEGTGFFVYSKTGASFIVTAGHVIGSSETIQERNPDWKVENGTVVRKITMEFRNGHGGLQSVGGDVFVAPTAALPGIDIALLMIMQDGYPTLPLAKSMVEKIPVHTVFLSGYQFGKEQITAPAVIGNGQLASPTTYKTSVSSHAGESGGAWVDLATGRVFAVARDTQTSPNAPSFESTPVTLIKPWLDSYFQQARLELDDSDKFPFKILTADGGASVTVTGDWGNVANTATTLEDFNGFLEASAKGAESSQCDQGAGRVISQAKAQSLVSKLSDNGLRFEADLAAQGGHFRTAVTCLGGLPVGLTGHDTQATAILNMNGAIKFKNADDGVAIKWTAMPDSGAKYQILGADGTIFKTGNMKSTGMDVIKGLNSGEYTVKAIIDEQLSNKGGCCGDESKLNATLTTTPLDAIP